MFFPALRTIDTALDTDCIRVFRACLTRVVVVVAVIVLVVLTLLVKVFVAVAVIVRTTPARFTNDAVTVEVTVKALLKSLDAANVAVPVATTVVKGLVAAFVIVFVLPAVNVIVLDTALAIVSVVLATIENTLPTVFAPKLATTELVTVIA
jgi:hypothetical protein